MVSTEEILSSKVLRSLLTLILVSEFGHIEYQSTQTTNTFTIGDRVRGLLRFNQSIFPIDYFQNIFW